jgi:hypothetical protein
LEYTRGFAETFLNAAAKNEPTSFFCTLVRIYRKRPSPSSNGNKVFTFLADEQRKEESAPGQ